MKLTGRFRYRSQHRWNRREELVLQYEWAGRKAFYYGGFVSSEDYVEWRDARTQDMTTATPTQDNPNNE